MNRTRRGLWIAALGFAGLLATDASAQMGGCAAGGMGAMRGGMGGMRGGAAGGGAMMNAGSGMNLALMAGMMPPPPRGMPGPMGQVMGRGGQCAGGSTSDATTAASLTASLPMSALSASTYSNLASLQTAAPPAASVAPNPLRRIDVSAMMRNLDRNDDGSISQDEMPARLRSRLLSADLNADRKVTLAELRAARSSR